MECESTPSLRDKMSYADLSVKRGESETQMVYIGFAITVGLVMMFIDTDIE